MSVADELQAITLQLNPLIERAENALARLYTRTASIQLPEGRALFFDEGRLYVGLTQPQRLKSTSRKTRLDALRMLPDLVRELEMAKVITEEVAETIIDQTKAYLDGLERPCS